MYSIHVATTFMPIFAFLTSSETLTQCHHARGWLVSWFNLIDSTIDWLIGRLIGWSYWNLVCLCKNNCMMQFNEPTSIFSVLRSFVLRFGSDASTQTHSSILRSLLPHTAPPVDFFCVPYIWQIVDSIYVDSVGIAAECTRISCWKQNG